ncbi:MAG: 3-hydroxybutyryl-CoA dehydrogenase [Dermatophilaceae bacterium]
MGEIATLGVLGGGLMGSGIAEVAARAGVPTVVSEVDAESAAAAERRVRSSLERSVTKGKASAEEMDAALAQLTFTADLTALADCDIVIEAATEHEETKLALFARLGEILTQPDAVLASNTSSLQIVRLATASGRTEHTVGLHFFSPVPLMKLVEVIPCLTTGSDALERARVFVTEKLGKTAIIAPDRPGFVVNVLLVPYMFAAIRLLEGAHASPEDIDTGMRLGCGHPMGPLALIDAIGLDTVRAAGLGMYEEFKDPTYAPPPLLNRLVDAGFLGKKSGRGFYDYS